MLGLPLRADALNFYPVTSLVQYMEDGKNTFFSHKWEMGIALSTLPGGVFTWLWVYVIHHHKNKSSYNLYYLEI